MGGTPKSSIEIEFSLTNHPFWAVPIVGNPHIYAYDCACACVYIEDSYLYAWMGRG
jgi:hypothetical protein